MRKNDSNRESEREQDFGSKTPGEEGTCGDGGWNSFGTAWQLRAALGERPVVVKGGHIFVINGPCAALLSPPAHMQSSCSLFSLKIESRARPRRVLPVGVQDFARLRKTLSRSCTQAQTSSQGVRTHTPPSAWEAVWEA